MLILHKLLKRNQVVNIAKALIEVVIKRVVIKNLKIPLINFLVALKIRKIKSLILSL